MADFEQNPDSGRLMATSVKKTPKSPDYWGEIAIDPSDLTNVQVVNGLHIYKLSGWKKTSKAGAIYLSVSVNRYIPEGTVSKPAKPAKSDMDDDIPF
jgi:hypothetical protein